MDCLQRIRELLDQRGWSVYRLSEKSGLPQSTLSNMFSRSNYPTVPTLERICAALGITMSEFFEYEKTNSEPSDIDMEMSKQWHRLDDKQKKAVLEILKLL